VTVGMGRWPFDRLVRGVIPLYATHDVFVQRGTSDVAVPGPSADFISFSETQRRMHEADVVITHGGNTVRLVQQLGKTPVVVAREARRGEMANDHQVRYVEQEAQAGRVLPVAGELDDLGEAVDQALRRGVRNVDRRPDSLEPTIIRRLDIVMRHEPTPFDRHPVRRYSWTFRALAGRRGRHLDLGFGDGRFLEALHDRSELWCLGVDAHRGNVTALHRRRPEIPALRVAVDGKLPLLDQCVDSISMLDVLAHTADDCATLREAHRVLRPGGLLLLSVPARHICTFLDPDNVKHRFPRVHGVVHGLRFSPYRYRARFVDAADALRGETSLARDCRPNYRPKMLLDGLRAAGFTPWWRDGANVFWQFAQVPQLLLPPALDRFLDRPVRYDGALFHRADLFVAATRDP
jgi:SAM-dependent methyltransferase